MSAAPGVVCERAEERDLPLLAELDRLGSSDPWSAREIASALAWGPRDLLLLSTCSGEAPAAVRSVLAYCAFQRVGPEAEIHRLVVRADQQRRGRGRCLLRLVLDKLQRDGATTVWLEVREGNAAARALYGSLGFVPGLRRRGYYQAPEEDALVLRAFLGPGARASDVREDVREEP